MSVTTCWYVLDLEFLLDAGVQKADVGLGAHDGFAVQFQQHAQHAVRGRVLRPHVQDHAPAVVLSFSFDFSGAGCRALRSEN